MDHQEDGLLYKNAFRNAKDALFLVDRRTGVVLDVNEAASAMVGQSREAMRDHDLRDFLPAEHDAIVAAASASGLEDRAPPPQMDVHREGQEETIPVEAEASSTPGPNPVVMLALRDVTQRRALESARHETQRVEVLQQIARGTAHELNNSLAAIMGIAEVLRRAFSTDAPAHEDIDALLAATRRGRKVIRELMGYAGMGMYRHERMDLNQVLVAAVDESGSPGTEIYTDLQATRFVEGDPDQLRLAFLNVLANAADALPAGGPIDVRSEDEGPNVRLTFQDAGVGMSVATARRAFEPFFTTKPVGTAAGMGLAMVDGVVRHHGGTVRIQSRRKVGTTVTILLPSVAAPPPTAPVGAEGPAGKRTVLLVDDDEWVRYSGRRLLEHLGFDVLEAEDGVYGLAEWASQGARIAMVMLDIRMPRMDGEKMLRRLRDAGAEVPVLLCTGFAREQLSQSLLSLGRVGFLEKPFDLEQLIAEIRRLKVKVPTPPGG